MNGLDWNLLRVFLAVARCGSITAAARRLRSSQPTVSRQVRQLEEQLLVPLIVRQGRGIRLTDKGAELAAAAAPIEDDVQAFIRVATGARHALVGTVRIAATEIVGTHVLIPRLAAMREALPRIDIDLVLDNRTADLRRGDADIAVRMFRPRQPDLVGRSVGGIPAAPYASTAYLDAHGRPRSMDELIEAGHVMVGFDSRGPLADFNTVLDPRLTADRCAFRTDSLVGQLEAVRAGIGVGGLQVEIASRYPELERVLPELPVPSMELWVVMHEDIRSGAHVRAVFNHVVSALQTYTASLGDA